MPEKTGTVTGFIKKRDGTPFGLNLDGEEYLYSFPDKRGEPWNADRVNIGDRVRVEYTDYTKDGNTKQYLAVIEWLDGASPQASESQEWGYENRDKLMAKENSISAAASLYAACINAGIIKELPTAQTIKAYAEALEAKVE